MKPDDTGVTTLSRLFLLRKFPIFKSQFPSSHLALNFTPSLLLPLFCLLNLLLPHPPLCIPLHPSPAFSSPVPETLASCLLPPFQSPPAATLSCSSLSVLRGYPPGTARKLDDPVLTFSILFRHIFLTVPRPQAIPSEHTLAHGPSTCWPFTAKLFSDPDSVITAQVSLLTSSPCFQQTFLRAENS